MAGKPEVAGVAQFLDAAKNPLEPAAQGDPFAGLLGAGCGEQVVGLTVVPAAVKAPDVADDEGRMVVNRA